MYGLSVLCTLGIFYAWPSSGSMLPPKDEYTRGRVEGCLSGCYSSRLVLLQRNSVMLPRFKSYEVFAWWEKYIYYFLQPDYEHSLTHNYVVTVILIDKEHSSQDIMLRPSTTTPQSSHTI